VSKKFIVKKYFSMFKTIGVLVKIITEKYKNMESE